jgi:TonB-linked SusC/RagA family outer membrane protein
MIKGFGRLLPWLFSACLSLSASAQPTRVISGRVTDDAQSPLSNATVQVKGGPQTVRTGADGRFSIQAATGLQTLVFSFVGMQTSELPVAEGISNVTFVMKRSEASLDEVVVVSTGYQTLPKERATGSFGTVSREQLDKPATNIASRIIGTNAGVQALRMDEEGNPFFQIRGLSTLYANQEPLVVVDGFPIQGTYNAINPNDVESVTILKDAAAASIWGARAVNGVIVVTTKNASKGTPLKVEFSAFTRIASKIDLDYSRPHATSAETVDYERLAYNKWGAQLNTGILANHQAWSWSLGQIALNEANLGFITAGQRDKTLDSLKGLDNRAQLSDLLLAKPVTQQYNLSLQSSTQRMSQALSLLMEKNQSNFRETFNDRHMMNYRTTASLAPWLDVSLNTMLQYNRATNNGSSLSELSSLSPYEMLANPDGSLTQTTLRYYLPLIQRQVPVNLFPYNDWSYNPAREIYSRSLVNTELNGRVQAGLTIKPMKGLNIESRIQYENFNTFSRNLYGENSFTVRQTVNHASFWTPGLPTSMTTTPIANLPKGAILDQSRSNLTSWNFRNLASFNRSFGKDHDLSAVAGTEIQNAVLQSFGQPRTYGYNDATLQLGIFPNGPGGTPSNGNQNGTSAPTNLTIRNWLNQTQTFGYTNSFGYTTERFFSGFANAAYTYRDKYTVSGSFRSDASNLITDDPAYRYAPFWSVGASWQVWKEDFMKGVEFVDRLSLRGTFGYNGNIDKSTAFMPLISLSGTPNVLTGAFTASFSSLGNPTLRWEKTGTTNIGIDYRLFRGRLFGKVDLYDRRGRDLIAVISIPNVNGSSSQRLNNAAMTNRGIEIEVGSEARIGKHLRWSGNLNFSYNRNRITDLFIAQYASSSLISRGTSAYAEGYNANTMWMFRYAGFNAGGQPTVLGPAGVNYDMQTFVPGDGREYLENTGTLVAPMTFGYLNSLSYRQLTFSFILTGNFGHVFQRRGFNYPVQWTTTRMLPNRYISDVLTGKSNDILTLPVNPNEPRFYFWDRFYNNLSYLSQNASWIRLQEVNLNWRVPSNWLGKAGFRNSSVYVQGNDLLVLLANRYGEDPMYPLGTLNPMPKFTFGFKCEL